MLWKVSTLFSVSTKRVSLTKYELIWSHPWFLQNNKFSHLNFLMPPTNDLPPMNRHRPYCQMNLLTGILHPCGNALGYRYASPNGDGRSHGTSTTHSVAHSPSATNPCRPTACTTHTTPSSSPSPSTVHWSLFTDHWSLDLQSAS